MQVELNVLIFGIDKNTKLKDITFLVGWGVVLGVTTISSITVILAFD